MKTIFLLLLTALSAITSETIAQDKFTRVKEEMQVPDFSVTMEDGSVKKLSESSGKVIWINFFATWCGPCLEELPHLEKEVFEKFKGNNDFELMVIGREHDWATVNKFKESRNYQMPFYPDPEREIFSKFAQQNIPRNFLIDKNGKIVVSSVGFKKGEFKRMIRKVGKLLK